MKCLTLKNKSTILILVVVCVYVSVKSILSLSQIEERLTTASLSRVGKKATTNRNEVEPNINITGINVKKGKTWILSDAAAESESSSSNIPEKTNHAQNRSSCWRHCPQRINKIYFEHGSAGLGDRLTVIHMLAQISGYLCAELEIPPPSITLNPLHNDGQKVNELVQWQDFRNMTFSQDNASVFVPKSTFGNDFRDWRRIPVYDKNKYSDWFHVVSENGGNLMDDYKSLQDFSWRQKADAKTGFVWEIHRSLYTSNLFDFGALLPEPPKQIIDSTEYREDMRPLLTSYRYFHPENRRDWGCLYTNDHDDVPSHMKLLRKKFSETVRRLSGFSNNSVYGFFHIRRGDSIDDCDTSLPVLQEFLNCSLNGTEATGKQVTFLVGSDETNVTYRENVMKLADNFPHFTMMDADHLTSKVIKKAIENGLIAGEIVNNFYVYWMQEIFRRKGDLSTIFLTRRKSHCPTCVPLMKWYSSAWI